MQPSTLHPRGHVDSLAALARSLNAEQYHIEAIHRARTALRDVSDTRAVSPAGSFNANALYQYAVALVRRERPERALVEVSRLLGYAMQHPSWSNKLAADWYRNVIAVHHLRSRDIPGAKVYVLNAIDLRLPGDPEIVLDYGLMAIIYAEMNAYAPAAIRMRMALAHLRHFSFDHDEPGPIVRFATFWQLMLDDKASTDDVRELCIKVATHDHSEIRRSLATKVLTGLNANNVHKYRRIIAQARTRPCKYL